VAKQLFGTDGIRGVAGEYPLDAQTIHAFGVALAEDAAGAAGRPEILIGADTRESGRWIAARRFATRASSPLRGSLTSRARDRL
jgi:phosphoglucosamine mutase